MSLVCIILGLVAIVDYKNANGITVFPFFVAYSPHSWLGIITMALFGVQVIYSVVIYYIMKWPAGTEKRKQVFVDAHHFIGHCMFAVGLATCATGLQDMQSSDLASSTVTTDDMSSMSGMTIMTGMTMGNATQAMAGYGPFSTDAQLASAGSVMLFVMGACTFAALKFLPNAQSYLKIYERNNEAGMSSF